MSKPFQAMIFAAGRGTRLKPITDSIPKALVRVGSKTMFDHVAERLLEAGASRLVVNVHHLGGLIVDHIRKHYAGVPVYVSYEPDELLETGGGLKKAAHLLIPDLPVIIHNVDVLSDIDFGSLLDYHLTNQALATLAVRSRETARYFLFDADNRLRGWENTKTDQQIVPLPAEATLIRKAFSGIHVVGQQIFNHFPPEQRFPMVDLYLKLCAEEKIIGFDHTAGYWTDIGKPEELAAAERLIAKNESV
ncbi:MAG TPA: nucleotidyltransferase [Bacteroidales bacterium]|nr:MAG: hypothetical protein A2X11_02955 [Bacteroidetes bacterium GWE2_42_24]OFY25489.1 MAG: hypothetical protein A2X09_13320 [Bacteroidetes bacterium GWF2_43_11]HBZ65480.1 nucleotidyltransferase [Bacteroidales bacterium]